MFSEKKKILLSGTDIIRPREGFIYIQSSDTCGTVILATAFVPIKECSFEIFTGDGGLYFLNNSAISYSGSKFLQPNKLHSFNLFQINSTWKLVSDSSYSEDNVIIAWTKFFNARVTGGPPLSSRKYAIFINGIYNAILDNSSMFDQAVANEAANLLAETLLPDGTVTTSVYSLYPQLEASELATVTISVESYLVLPLTQIPSQATDTAYSIPEPAAQTKWFGTNPVLPNWNPDNIDYIGNTFTDLPDSPVDSMAAEAASLQQITRTTVTNEIAYHFANTAPPAHLIAITYSTLADKNLSVLQLCKILALVSIGIADAGLYAWTVKYTYWGARPFQYITGYQPLIATPNFPGYISGHSTFSAAWGQLLGMTTPSLLRIAKYIADLSGISRLYGGIHFSSDNDIGLSSGESIGKAVYQTYATSFSTNQPFIN